MFNVNRDLITKLEDVPQSSVGAPCPMVVASEHFLALIYFLQEREATWDGTTVRVIDPNSSGIPVAVLKFFRPMAHTLGPPNDEAISGHPLYKKGLRPYSALLVNNSSWIDFYCKINSAHPHHNAKSFAAKRHYIMAFHDSIFECIADRYTIDVTSGSVAAIAVQVATDLTSH